MNNVNGMIVIPIMTPYGTQLVPMPMNQLMASGLGDNLGNLAMQQQQAQQANAMLNNVAGIRNMQTIQNQLRNLQNTQNPIVSSILQQQAQIIRQHQKLTASQTANQKAANQAANQIAEKKKNDLGAIGDLRPMYRSQSRGQSSGFSSENASESDSGSSSSRKVQLIQKATGLNLKQKTQSITSSSHFSSNSSGWSESGSGDEMTQAAKNNIKLLEQRSGSKSLFLQKMVEVLEGYFSDDGLKRNQFLAKQLQLNPDGIPLKKVAAMRRVKALTRDLLTVASAVRRSPILELSRDGCLVRRIVKPTLLEPPKPIRTVLAINLGTNVPTVESVTSSFAKYGELTQVRVIRPTSSLPNYLKEFTMWVPDLGNSVCAIIEFETQEEAQAACREINMANRDEGKLRVALLKPGARIRRTLYRKYKDDEINEVVEKQVSKVHLKIHKGQNQLPADSGHGSDGSNELSTENSEDDMPHVATVATKVVTRRSWMSKVYQPPKSMVTSVIRQPTGPVGSSRGFAPRHALKRRELLSA